MIFDIEQYIIYFEFMEAITSNAFLQNIYIYIYPNINQVLTYINQIIVWLLEILTPRP